MPKIKKEIIRNIKNQYLVLTTVDQVNIKNRAYEAPPKTTLEVLFVYDRTNEKSLEKLNNEYIKDRKNKLY